MPPKKDAVGKDSQVDPCPYGAFVNISVPTIALSLVCLYHCSVLVPSYAVLIISMFN